LPARRPSAGAWPGRGGTLPGSETPRSPCWLRSGTGDPVSLPSGAAGPAVSFLPVGRRLVRGGLRLLLNTEQRFGLGAQYGQLGDVGRFVDRHPRHATVVPLACLLLVAELLVRPGQGEVINALPALVQFQRPAQRLDGSLVVPGEALGHSKRAQESPIIR